MKIAIVLIFVLVIRIGLNVVLPSFDIYSDITLAYKIFTFNLGDSLLMAGCRVCQGKNETDIYTLKNKSCQQCLTSSRRSEVLEIHNCGDSYEFLDKIHELERRDTCENEDLSMTFYFNKTTYSYILKKERCDSLNGVNSNVCRVENKNGKNISSWIDPLGKSFFAFNLNRMGYEYKRMIYNPYLLYGRLSIIYCQSVFFDYFTKTSQKFYAFVNNNVSTIKSPAKSELYLKLRKSRNGKISLEKGYTYEDGCGILFRDKQDDNALFIQLERDGMCGLDSCLIHLQSLKFWFNISSIDEWKYKTLFVLGTKVGGQTCQLLWKYGLVLLVPIFLNMIFSIFVFFEDLNNGKATMIEIVFIPLMCYPQWKTLRILGTFIYNRNKDKLDEAINKFDSEVAPLEPFLESAMQVS